MLNKFSNEQGTAPSSARELPVNKQVNKVIKRRAPPILPFPASANPAGLAASDGANRCLPFPPPVCTALGRRGKERWLSGGGSLFPSIL